MNQAGEGSDRNGGARGALDALRYARRIAPITEAVAAVATEMGAMPTAGLRGLLALASGASAEEAAQRISETRDALTYSPRNPRVRRMLEGASDVIGLPSRAGAALADAATEAIPALRRGARDFLVEIPSAPRESDRPSAALLTGISMAPDVATGALGARMAGRPRATGAASGLIEGKIGSPKPILSERAASPRVTRSIADLAASGEAISRVAGQRARGERLFKYDTLRGKASPLPLTVDAVDVQPGPREIILRVRRDGRVEIDQGKVGSKVPPGILKRAQQHYEEMLGPSGGVPDEKPLKPTLPTTEAERQAMIEAAKQQEATASMSAEQFNEMRYKGDRPLPGAKVATPDDPFVIDYVEGADVPVEMAIKVIQANYNDTFANNERIAGRPVPPIELSMDPKKALKAVIAGATLDQLVQEQFQAPSRSLAGIPLDENEHRGLVALHEQLVRRATDSLRGSEGFHDAPRDMQREIATATMRYAERMARAHFVNASPRLKAALAARMAERRSNQKERTEAVSK